MKIFLKYYIVSCAKKNWKMSSKLNLIGTPGFVKAPPKELAISAYNSMRNL